MTDSGLCRPTGLSNKFVGVAFLSFGLFLWSFMASHIPFEVLHDMVFGNAGEGKENEYAKLVASENWYNYGKSISTIVSGFIVFRISSKMFFGTGITGSAVSTLLLPVALANGHFLIMLVNTMKGIFEGMIFPPMMVLCGFWFPPAQITTLLSIVIFGLYIGQVSNVLLWNHLSMKDSWTQYYYLTGGFGILWAVFYFWLMREKPIYYSSINSEIGDVSIINRFLINNRISVRKLPWKKMLRSKSTISLIMLIVCRSLNFLILSCTILALHHEIDRETIVYTSLGSSVAASIIIVFSGIISDYLRCKCQLSTTLVRKLFCVGALFGSGVVLPFIGLYSNNSSIHLAFFGVAVVLEAIIFLNAIVNVLDIAPRTAGLLFALLFGLGSIIAHLIFYVVSMIIVLNGHFSDKDFEIGDVFTFKNLQIFFITNIVINILSGILYGCIASGDKQEFWEDNPMILIGNMPQQSSGHHNDATNQNINENLIKYPTN